MKKFYVLEKGVMTASGTGDFYAEERFTTLKEAQKRMHQIAKDTKGYAFLPTGGYVETMITMFKDEEDYDFGVGEVIDGTTYYYKK